MRNGGRREERHKEQDRGQVRSYISQEMWRKVMVCLCLRGVLTRIFYKSEK